MASLLWPWFYSFIFPLAVFCSKDVNILSAVLIIFATRILDEAAYRLLFNPDLLLKIKTYPLLAYLIYRFKGDELVFLAMAIWLLCIGAEIYWLLIAYQAPDIMWSMIGITLNMAFRRALILPLFVVEKLFPNRAKDILIDFIIRQLVGAHIIVCALMIIEYLVRHINLASPLYVYNSYAFFSQTIALITLWVLIHQS